MNKLFLKKYTGPRNYEKEFWYNLKEIDNISNIVAYQKLVKILVKISNVEFDVAMLDLKRYIMVKHEYKPESLKFNWRNIMLPFVLVLKWLIFYFTQQKITIKKQIIIDVLCEGAPSFYGNEIIKALQQKYLTLITNINKVKVVCGLLDFIKVFFSYIEALIYSAIRFKDLSIDLSKYLYEVYMLILKAKGFKSKISPNIIISENDNGASSFFIKACGAFIILIQNGLRGYSADSCFKYSDVLFSMGGDTQAKMRIKMGCLFLKQYFFGSLQLHNYLVQKKLDIKNDIDVLWVSGGNLFSVEFFDKEFDIKDTRKAISLINEYAKNSGLVVAYLCKQENEVNDLKKLSLWSENIQYIERKNYNSYDVLHRSRLVLSSGSTMSLEALTIGKTIGLINWSNNITNNALFGEMECVFLGGSLNSFNDFLNHLLKHGNINRIDINQNQEYSKDFLKIIEDII